MRREVKAAAVDIVSVVVAVLATSTMIFLGKFWGSVVGALVILFSLWHLDGTLEPWRNEKAVQASLRGLGGRATEGEIDAALSATVSDGTVYEQERLEDLRIALARLREKGRIVNDNQHLVLVEK